MTVLVASGILLGAQQVATQKDAWDISVDYPRFRAKGNAPRMATAMAIRAERADFDRFLAEAKREVPKLKKMGAPGRYGLSTKPFVVIDRPKLASGYIERYAYQGGAHGQTTYRTFNYIAVEGAMPLTFANLFAKPSISEVTQCIIRAFKRGPVPSGIESGSFKRLNAEQANRFVVGKSGVMFLFDQGEIGSEAEGAMAMTLTFSQLPKLNPKVMQALKDR